MICTVEIRISMIIKENHEINDQMDTFGRSLQEIVSEKITNLNQEGIVLGAAVNTNVELSAVKGNENNYNVALDIREMVNKVRKDIDETETKKKPQESSESLIEIDERIKKAFDLQIAVIGKENEITDVYYRGLFNGMEVIRAARDNRPVRFKLPVH